VPATGRRYPYRAEAQAERAESFWTESASGGNGTVTSGKRRFEKAIPGNGVDYWGSKKVCQIRGVLLAKLEKGENI
jgi:hypothetical protein